MTTAGPGQWAMCCDRESSEWAGGWWPCNNCNMLLRSPVTCDHVPSPLRVYMLTTDTGHIDHTQTVLTPAGPRVWNSLSINLFKLAISGEFPGDADTRQGPSQLSRSDTLKLSMSSEHLNNSQKDLDTRYIYIILQWMTRLVLLDLITEIDQSWP